MRGTITKDGILVRCSCDELIDPQTLKPHPRNPNTHPAKQLELYSKIVRYQGTRRPITVSRRSGFITRGHGFHEMGLIERLQQVPVEYQDYESEEMELADVLADNLLAELAELSQERMRSALAELNTGTFDLELSGMPTFQLEKIFETNMNGLKMEFGANPAAPVIGSGAEGVSSLPSGNPSAAPEPPQAVKCIQFFISLGDVAEYEDKVKDLMIHYFVDNPSDAVLSAVREVHSIIEAAKNTTAG